MRNFYNFMRHMQLINWKIVIYSCEELRCLFRGGSLKPSFTPETMSEYMEDLRNGNGLKPLPMGAYEYDCCIEYLKKIRHQLISARKNFKSLVLVFDEVDNYQNIIPPLEDCLEKVSKEIGFDVIAESFGSESYEYTLESIFWEIG